MIQNLDIHCLKSHYFSNAIFVTKVQNQEITIKKPCIEEFRPKKVKLANSKFSILFRFNKAIKLNY